jgi:hypothetical protein
VSKGSKKSKSIYTRAASGEFDDRIASLADQIPSLFPEVSKLKDLNSRIASFKRDLAYLGAAADTEHQVKYCIHLALFMNFGRKFTPSILDEPVPVSSLLYRRMEELRKCQGTNSILDYSGSVAQPDKVPEQGTPTDPAEEPMGKGS